VFKAIDCLFDSRAQAVQGTTTIQDCYDCDRNSEQASIEVDQLNLLITLIYVMFSYTNL